MTFLFFPFAFVEKIVLLCFQIFTQEIPWVVQFVGRHVKKNDHSHFSRTCKYEPTNNENKQIKDCVCVIKVSFYFTFFSFRFWSFFNHWIGVWCASDVVAVESGNRFLLFFNLTGIDLGLNLFPCGHWSMLWSVFDLATVLCQTTIITELFITCTIEFGESPFFRNENLQIEWNAFVSEIAYSSLKCWGL